jgi:hypothetical protein
MFGPGEVWVLIPVVAIVMWGLQGVARALRGLPEPRSHHRSRGHRAQAAPDEVAGPDEAVRAELDDMRRRLTELEERQDFAERLLTRAANQAEGRDRAS